MPNFTPADQPFIIGKAIKMNEGHDVTILATGHLVYPAVQAAYILEEQGFSVEVLDITTIKPLDEEAVLASLAKTKCAVTAEEHLRNGGLGDAICQLAARKLPVPIEMVAVDDKFGESGKPDELMTLYGLDTEHIVDACKQAIARKQ